MVSATWSTSRVPGVGLSRVLLPEITRVGTMLPLPVRGKTITLADLSTTRISLLMVSTYIPDGPASCVLLPAMVRRADTLPFAVLI